MQGPSTLPCVLVYADDVLVNEFLRKHRGQCAAIFGSIHGAQRKGNGKQRRVGGGKQVLSRGSECFEEGVADGCLV